MIAIQIADYFVLKKKPFKDAVNVQNLVIWVIGFAAYRILMRVDTPVGNTLPDMVLTVLICIIVSSVRGKPQTAE
jgi:purine-cytosine permease-like protein